jgi:hypothetical protein
LVLLTCLALVALNDYRQQQRNREAAANLSDILATQLASSASQAMLTRDRLSLQAQVTGLASHRAIATAAIYDATNKPLAVSGSNQTNEAYNIEATITVDDSVAGYARVSLTEPLKRLGWQDPLVILMAILCAGLTFAAAIRPAVQRTNPDELNAVDPNFTIEVTGPPQGQPSEPAAEQLADSNEAGTAAGEEPAVDMITAADSQAVTAQVVLELNQALEHPLSAILADAIQQVCQLYNGSAKPMSKGVIVDFGESEGEDFNFRAFCAGRLWQQLLDKINQQHPSVAAHIWIRQNSEQEETQQDQQLGDIYLSRLVLAQGELSAKISIVEEEGDWYRVKSVSEEIDRLLQNQLEHLISTLQDKYGEADQPPPVN